MGFLLMTWSYHPEKPVQAIRYTTWTLPKKCIATVRGWLQWKPASDVYNPSAGWIYMFHLPAISCLNAFFFRLYYCELESVWHLYTDWSGRMPTGVLQTHSILH